MKAVFSGGENKGQRVHVAFGEVYVQKKFFYCDSSQSLEQCPQGYGRVRIGGGFQDSVGCWAISSRLPFV